MYLTMLRGQLAELIEKRDAALTWLDGLAAKLTEEKRSADEAEDAEITARAAEATKLKDDIAKKEAEIAELVAVEEQRKNTQPPAAPAFTGRAGGGQSPYDYDVRSAPRTAEARTEQRDRAFRAVEVDEYLSDENRSRLDAMLRDRKVNSNGSLARHILVTGDPEYRELFLRGITGQQTIVTERGAHLLRQAEEYRAAINVATDANGGYLMPFTLDPTVILTSSGVVNPVRMLADVATVATDNWQGITSAGITASYDAEAAEVSDDTPTFGQPAIAIHQAQAYAQASLQAVDDLDGLGDELSTLFADARDTLELSKFTLGSGTAEPFGFVTDATKVTSTTTDTYAVADVYKLQNAVSPRFQQNATWQASLAVINLTRAFGTALGHAFLTDLGGGQPPQILGQSLYQNSGMDSSVTALADNYILAYGDMKNYKIRDRIGMTVQFIPFVMGASFRPTGQVGWYVRWRNGAKLVNANAVQVMNVT